MGASMFYLRYPEPTRISLALDACADQPFTYDAVGATRERPPPGYRIDRYGTSLGHGRETFSRARAAVCDFAMYPRRWIRIHRWQHDIRPGVVFGAIVQHLGFYSVQPCRIVYTIDEERQFGFALGTLPGHAATGEERFLVSWDPDDDQVTYQVLAFSRPHAPLARLGAVIARRLQKQFSRDSMQSMREAVAERPAAER